MPTHFIFYFTPSALFLSVLMLGQAVAQSPGNALRGAPINMDGLTSTLKLSDAQASEIIPLIDDFNRQSADLTRQISAAREKQKALQAEMAALFTPEQQKTLIVSDLTGTYDDHNYMMSQLGIVKLRPGKNGSKQTGPGFELATANPWKETMPELMKMNDGTPVTKAEQWPARRREIAEDFEREIYGRVPANAPKVTWEITKSVDGEVGGQPIVTHSLVGHVDNSQCPHLKVDIQASVSIPSNASAPVPVLMAFGGGGLAQAIPKGWGVGSIIPTSIQPDSGGQSLRQGVIGIANKGQPRRPDDWGALRAWGWGLSRLIDFFEQHPELKIAATKIGITGVSRYGKAAIVAQAFDERVSVALVGSSGQGGVKLHRHDFGEAVENLTGGGGYHWMAGNYLKYGAEEASFGRMDAGNLPVDSHQLLALCAPRPCFISYGIEAKGDPKWVGAPGSFMAGILAGPAYELLGKKGFGIDPSNYINAPMPPVQQLVGHELAWRQHEGGHTQEPNFTTFFDWVSDYVK